ncbi:hypothetical protein E6C76_17120 [Pseudothauera nasutitermitis]|uniref:Uncharacterized protein n=1 Tax=Pseudothauera nasutitermitis TaxID=2565930 RepID=A0A4S4AT09_9RHOO|nr:hypothetical protein [Pseudothauera nasutitermitis]THF62982.1 hypothetical protein E6C76_17120 [Pseudothauera nasutitermitis]
MKSRNTLLFGSALLAATVAVIADHQANAPAEIPEAARASAPSSESASQDDDEGYAPCGAI